MEFTFINESDYYHKNKINPFKLLLFVFFSYLKNIFLDTICDLFYNKDNINKPLNLKIGLQK